MTRTITATAHYRPGTSEVDHITVDVFPDEIDVSPLLLEEADPRFLQTEGEIIRIVAANGTAEYRRTQLRGDGVNIRCVRVSGEARCEG